MDPSLQLLIHLATDQREGLNILHHLLFLISLLDPLNLLAHHLHPRGNKPGEADALMLSMLWHLPRTWRFKGTSETLSRSSDPTPAGPLLIPPLR